MRERRLIQVLQPSAILNDKNVVGNPDGKAVRFNSGDTYQVSLTGTVTRMNPKLNKHQRRAIARQTAGGEN
jgi:hypothetical protein